MRDEVLFSVEAQDLDTYSYQVSNFEDIEFNLGEFTTGHGHSVQTRRRHHFSPITFDDISMGGSVGNPIVLDEEEDKVNSLPSTPECVRPAETPRLQRSLDFGAIVEKVPDYIYKNLFQ